MVILIIYSLFSYTCLKNPARVLPFVNLDYIWIFRHIVNYQVFAYSAHIVSYYCGKWGVVWLSQKRYCTHDKGILQMIIYFRKRLSEQDGKMIPGVNNTLGPKQNDRYILRRQHFEIHFLLWQLLYFYYREIGFDWVQLIHYGFI